MNNQYYVYEWVRLDTNEPFYVGKGQGDRCYRKKRGNNQHFNNIVKNIPTAVVILHEGLTEEQALEIECWYIHQYEFEWGYNLVNLTEGGEGVTGYRHSEEEIKRNRSQTHGFNIHDYEKEIIDLYVNKFYSALCIANHYKVSKQCILRLLERCNIPRRTSGETMAVNYTGQKRYNAQNIMVNNTITNECFTFESQSLCAKWLVNNNIVNTVKSGIKIISKYKHKNIQYKKLCFTVMDKSEQLPHHYKNK